MNQQLYVLTFMDVTLVFIVVPFTLVHGYLLSTGQTTIEIFERNSGRSIGRIGYSLQTWKECIYACFGSLDLNTIFSLNLRDPPFSGLEWSFFQKELGFNEFGEPQKMKNE